MKYDFEAESCFEDLVRFRRDLHRIPELGNEEHKTHAYLWEQLSALEPDDLRAFVGTGIRAVFRGDGSGRVIAFRSDMDALPVEEPEGCPFRSTHPGRMHACGHDGHMATLLAFAKWISARRTALRDDVVLIFQPAEETTGGAQRMIDEGVLKNPDVQAIYGMHMMPTVPIGSLAVREGPIMALTCEIDILIDGKSSHGASPHLGRDAIMAMGHLLVLLQTTVARSLDPTIPALLTIGRCEAGVQRNILADHAHLKGIIRTFSNEVFARLEECIQSDLRGIEKAFGVECELRKYVYYPCTTNDPAETRRAIAVMGERYLPADALLIAEDFSCYQLQVPGVFIFTGCRDDAHQASLHARDFGFDEHALIPALAFYAGMVSLKEESHGTV